MRLVIDVREACRENRTGKGQWVYGFVSELLKRDLDVHLLTDRQLPSSWHCSHTIFSTGFLWHLRVWHYLRSHSSLYYISPTSFLVPFFLPKMCAFALVIHDLIAFFPEPHNRKAKIMERLLLKRALHKASHIFTVSLSTAHDLQSRFAVSSTPIFAGAKHNLRQAYSPRRSTIVSIGTLCPRKNQLRLIQAYNTLSDEIRSQYSLDLYGSDGWGTHAIHQLIASSDGVSWHGYMTSDEYNAALQECAALALPSLYEGFGMQVLDALTVGIPVLTSDRGSLCEVAGDAAVIVDPESVSSIAQGLERILLDASTRSLCTERGPLRASRFTWEAVVDHFLEGIQFSI